MGKTAIILGSNIHWAPYYYRYEKCLLEANTEFDLIYWNREGIPEESKANLIQFTIPDVSNNKNPFKVWKFIAFSNFVKRTIRKNKYDKLIFLGTHGCAVSFCAGYLSKHYCGKLWIDIRDNQYEWFPPFYWGEKKSIEASYETVISSFAYTRFLPEHDYLHIHNIDPNASEMIRNFNHIPDELGRIRISFIGNVRYYDQNKRLINLLGNDDRFVLQYYGKGSETLQAYCSENHITNVDFYGTFSQEETIRFYEKTDIINNMYGNETMNLQLALSNKLYYSLFLELPILVSDHTLMQELTEEYKIGFTFVDDVHFADRLYNWYQSVQRDKSICRFGELWNRVYQEDCNCIKRLEAFLAADGCMEKAEKRQ